MAAVSGKLTPLSTIDYGIFGDNFNRANSSTVGNNWSDVQTGVYSIASSLLSCTNSSPASSAYLRDYLIRQSSENSIPQHIETVTTLPGGAISIGCLLRYQTSTKNNYLVSVSGAVGGNLTVAIYTVVGGSVGSTLVAARAVNISAPSATNLRVRIVVEAVGTNPTTINLRVFNESTGAILENSTITDSTSSLQTSGAVGLCCWSLAAAQTFEEFTSSSMPSTQAYNLVFEGDSITRSDQASSGAGTCFGTTYPAKALAALGYLDWKGTNLGTSGQLASTMASNAATRAAANFVNGATNVVIVMGGTNDLGIGSQTPAQTWTSIQSIATTWKAAGYKVCLCTILPAANAAYPSNFDSMRTTLNGLIRSGWKSIADGICDIGGHGTMGQTGSENRRYYFAVDRTHPNDAGCSIFGLEAANAVATMLGI